MMTATDEERLPILRVRGRDSGCDRNGDDDRDGDGDGDEGALYLDHQGERRSASNPRRAKGVAAATSQNRPRAPGATPNAPPAAEAACAAAPSSSTPLNPRPHTRTHTPRHPAAPSKGSTSTSPPSSSSPGPDDPNNPPAAVGAYLRQFQLRAVECVANAHDRSHCVSRTRASGALGTSLPEDVAFLFETQLSVLREYLRSQPAVPAPPAAAAAKDDNDRRKNPGPPSLWETRRGQELYCDATMSILECLIHTQRCAGPVFLTTLECCCEAANDLARLADKMDQMLASYRSVPSQQQQLKDAQDDTALEDGPVTARWNEYVALLSQDAVKAAERTHVFVIRDFVSWHQHGRHRRGHRGSSNSGTAAPSALFSYQWEVECTNNEIITSLLEDVCDRDHWSRIRRYLDADVLRNKALVALCRAVVCYYVRCLVERADSAAHRGRRQDHHVLRRRAKQVLGMDRHRAGGFLHAGRALRRMKDDIALIKQYFVGKACGNATLTRILSNEVYILELIHECLEAAADLGEETGGRDGGGDGGGLGDDHGSDHMFLDSFIVVIHKRTGGDALVTRHFVGDLFMLVNHQERPLQLTVLQQDLHLVTMRMEEVKRGGGGGGFGDPNKAKKKNAELSLVSVDQMLRAMYEDRIVQGMLPLCWTCLPKVEAEDGGMELVSAKIREITRGVADLRMKRNSSF